MTTRTPKDEAVARKLIEKLDLPADADDGTILAALDRRTNKIATAEVSAAITDGKILAAHRDYWTDAFKADFTRTRNVLASLAPNTTRRATTIVASLPAAAPHPVPARPAVTDDERAEARADAALWAMGYRGADVPEPPKTPWWEIFPPGETSTGDLLAQEEQPFLRLNDGGRAEGV